MVSKTSDLWHLFGWSEYLQHHTADVVFYAGVKEHGTPPTMDVLFSCYFLLSFLTRVKSPLQSDSCFRKQGVITRMARSGLNTVQWPVTIPLTEVSGFVFYYKGIMKQWSCKDVKRSTMDIIVNCNALKYCIIIFVEGKKLMMELL